jgi:hypothetical protein
MLLGFTCFAQDSSISPNILEKIITNDAFCVKGYTEDKIYLCEDRIYPTTDGLFLALNEAGDFVPLSRLSSDASGCFVAVSSDTLRASLKILSDCPWCGKPYFIKCRNKDCPGKPKKK